MEAALESPDGARAVQRQAGSERRDPRPVPARDLREPRVRQRITEVVQASALLDAVGDSGTLAERRRLRVEQLQVRALAVQVQAGVHRILAHRRPLLQRAQPPQWLAAFRRRERLAIRSDVEVIEEHPGHDLIFSTNGVFTTRAGTGLPRISTSNADPSLASAAGT